MRYIIALTAVHRKGYVHRDMSTGNVLLVNRGTQHQRRDVGVLIDFEYCKVPGETATESNKHRMVSDQVQTSNAIFFILCSLQGTLHFMSSEALSRTYQLFHSKLLPHEFPPINDWPVWFYNYIHDIESIW